MSTIKLANLHPAGTVLFDDSESFLTDFRSDELQISGGFSPSHNFTFLTTTIIQEDTPYIHPVQVTVPATAVTIVVR
jgi:hypothetical protein